MESIITFDHLFSLKDQNVALLNLRFNIVHSHMHISVY